MEFTNITRKKMSPTSIGEGGEYPNRRRAHISRLVRREASPFRENAKRKFCLWQNWNNGVIIYKGNAEEFCHVVVAAG